MHGTGAYHALYDMILDFVMTRKDCVLCSLCLLFTIMIERLASIEGATDRIITFLDYKLGFLSCI